MLLRKINLVALTLCLWCMAQLSCTRKWDDHNKINEEELAQNLYEKIAADQSLSKFAGYLQKTGYSDTLQLNNSFTVWAPTDAALQSIDATLSGNADLLKKFVAHHIARLSWYTSQAQPAPVRLALLDGKYGIFKQAGFEEAAISNNDQLAANGVLHTITGAATPLVNCWEYIDVLKGLNYNMATYLKSLTYITKDTSRAVQTGIDPRTGEPIYDPNTLTVTRNTFLDTTYDVSNEAKQYTVFIMDNPTWEKERAKLDTFYKTGSADTTLMRSQLSTAKDMVVEGAYAPDQLPDSVQSRWGVWFQVNRSGIQSVYRTSNGYVYVMKSLEVKLWQRFKPYLIQGEIYSGTSNNSYSPIYIRTLINPITGQAFKDLYAYNHGAAKWHVRYRIRNVPTVVYKIYWATYNNRWNNTLNQRLSIGDANNGIYRNVPYNIYNEEYLGDFKVGSYGSGILDLYLVSADIAPSSSNQNTTALFLDYIRMEPVIQ